ncbi:MAG: hypothetical protein FWD51_01815 [Betaproteobacteria bacterium]|nr:hypothetical protein [Betaproteobacteria bacterium]
MQSIFWIAPSPPATPSLAAKGFSQRQRRGKANRFRKGRHCERSEAIQ